MAACAELHSNAARIRPVHVSHSLPRISTTLLSSYHQQNETCSSGAYRELSNQEFLELKLTSERLSEPFHCRSQTLLLQWLQRFCAIDVGNRTEKQLQARATKIQTKYKKLLANYRKSRHHKNAPSLLCSIRSFLCEPFSWKSGRIPSVSGNMIPLSFNNEIYSPSPPTYDEVVKMDAPPPYDDVMYPYRSDNDRLQRQYLRSGTNFSRSPSKNQIKEQKRKAEALALKMKKKLKVVGHERDQFKEAVGVQMRDLLKQRDTAFQAVRDYSEKAKKSEIDSAIVGNLSRQVEMLTSERDLYEEEASKWKDTALVLMDEVNESHIKYKDVTEKMQKNTAMLKGVAKEKKKLSTKLLWKERETCTLRQKIAEVENNLEQDREAATVFYDGIVTELESQLSEKVNKQEELENRIKELTTLETQGKGGLYKTEIRLVYYHLLTLGVSANQIEPVIQTVLQNLSPVDTKGVSLPKRSTAQRIKTEAGQLATLRGLVEWSKREDKSVAYMTDKTTKGQLEWLTHKLVLSPNNEDRENNCRTIFTLGLRPVVGGKSQDTLNDLQDLLSELHKLGIEMGLPNIDETCSVINIKSRMSDRAASEVQLTKLLSELKTRELERLIPQWNQMSSQEKEDKIKVHAFTCGAHKLTNMAEAMNKAAVKLLYPEELQNKFRGMVGAKKHIYETDKLLCEQSHKEYAKGKEFKAYCLSREIHDQSGSQLFKPIVGSRYLIYFHNSIPTYVGKEVITLFLIDHRDAKGHWNKLEASVHSGYNDQRIMAEERAYAILYYEVCLPLMMKTKSVQHILEMNCVYSQSINKLKEWSQDPEGLFEGSERLWPGAVRNESLKTYILEVRRQTDTDDQVKKILKVCCEAGAAKLSQHAKEHLPGGEFASPLPKQIDAARLLKGATNDECESDFGLLDQMKKLTPSSNPISLSSGVRSKRDRATEWAMMQTIDVQNKVVQTARKQAIKQRKLFGTKNQQLILLNERKEKDRQKKILQRRETIKKRQRKRELLLKELNNNKLIIEEENIRKLNGRECTAQFQLWCFLVSEGVQVKNSEKVAGTSKLRVHEKRNELQQLVKANTDIQIKLQNMHFINGSEAAYSIVDVESSSDEEDTHHNDSNSDDDLPLAGLRQENTADSDDDLPLAGLRQENTADSDDNLPLAGLRQENTTDSDDDLPLAGLRQETTLADSDDDLPLAGLRQETTLADSDDDLPLAGLRQDTEINSDDDLPLCELVQENMPLSKLK